MNKTDLLNSLKAREESMWKMTAVFLENKDAHGVMDMGAELQAIQRVITELSRLE